MNIDCRRIFQTAVTQSHLPISLRPFLFASMAVIVVFVGYEIIERTWLDDADMDLIHQLHLARGLFASFLAALLALWLVTRASVPLHGDALSADAWERGARPDAQEQLAEHVQWLIQLRWIAVVLATVLTLYAVISGIIPTRAQQGLAATVAILVLSNVSYTALVRHRQLNRYLLPAQVYADLFLLTVFIHFSGGIENPLSLAMIFYVIIAGFVLGRRQCYAVATVGAVLFGLLGGSEAVGLLPHYMFEIFPHPTLEGSAVHAADSAEYSAHRIILYAALLFVSAYIISTLRQHIQNDKRKLSLLADRAFNRQQMLEQALEATGTGLGMFDPELHPVWTNRRWQSWFANPPAAAAADSLPSLADTPIRETLQDGGAHLVEGSATTSQADTHAGRVFHIATAPLHDSQGRITHAVAVAWEITQHKQSQTRLAQAEKLAAVGELAGHVAHEVNNPIGILTAKARLLLSDRHGEMSETVQMELGKIIELGDRVAQIAQGLLSYCRPSSTAQGLLDIRDPVRGAIAMVEHRAGQARIRIVQRLDGSLPLVHGNTRELQQVFVNLLLNAIDAMPSGGELCLTANRGHRPDHAGCVTVVVEDTGTGILSEIRDRVFETFFTTKSDGKGTGLGLPVCAELVRSHGGDIDITSLSPHGARVRVTLPIAESASGVHDG